MKYLDNFTNFVRTATLAATHILASNVIWRTDQEDKAGGGDVSLGGDYTGASDVLIDVEIVDNVITGDPNTSEPIFVGHGNAVLSDVLADATVDVQTIRITVVDLGTTTLPAQAPFQGVILRSKVTGDDGNLITVTIDRTGLVKTETDFTLPHDFQEGSNGVTGDEWNFGNIIIDPNTGNLSEACPRASFGLDQQVYRLWKSFDGVRYTYYTSPDPVRSVAQGSKVYTITGAYTITVDNTVDPPEVFTTVDAHPIVTLYDALTALQASTLVEVVGVVVNDRKPNGMAIDDLSVYTNTYVSTIEASGSLSARRAVGDFEFTTGQSGSTTTLTFTCTANNVHNGEVWDVYDANGGQLESATTGVPYASSPYTALIPPVNTSVDSVPASAGFLVELDLFTRSPTEVPPTLCVIKPRLGAAAHDGVWEFRYEQRPAKPCDCNNGDMDGGPSADCLGLEVEGGGAVSAKADIQVRKQKLISALRGYIEGNTTPPQTVDSGDVQWLKTSFGIFSDALDQMDTSEEATLDADFPDFQTAHAYLKGDQILIPANGYRFLVTQAGTSAGSAPTWPLTPGDAVASNTVIFVNMGLGPMGMWDAAFTSLKSDSALIGGQENPQNFPLWAPGVAYPTGVRVVPTQQNGFYFQHQGLYNDAGSLITLDDGGNPGPAPSGAIEPHWNLTDGDTTQEHVGDNMNIQWGTVEYPSLAVQLGVTDAYFDRYRSQMNDVLFAAGVDPANFDQASTEGDGCWHDAGGGYWFVYTGNDRAYLPIQPGVYYHAAVKTLNADGQPVYNSTHEWGFGPKFGDCESLLKPNDIIRVTISGTGNSGAGSTGYQQDDKFVVTVVHADPVGLTGGQDGDDTITLSVVGTEHAFENYEFITTGPTPYDDDGFSFTLTNGTIPLALGDQWTLDVEGGRWQWRADGGGWTGPLDIADTVSIGSAGLVVAFASGSSPSWVAGDRWSFKAEATNGPDGLRSLTDRAFAWATNTVIDITPPVES